MKSSAPCNLQAEVYKYTDESGRMVFVDDPDKIPPRFRAEAGSVLESGESGYSEPLETIDEDDKEGADGDEAEIVEGNTGNEEEQSEAIYDSGLQQRALGLTRLEEKRRSYQTPAMIRFGEEPDDEVFITHEAATAGVEIENTGSEPLVGLRYFGPDTGDNVPNVGDAQMN